ncbi:hypothetical protein RYX36_001623 [Vicia faba]
MWTFITSLYFKLCKFFKKAWDIGVNDPRKFIHCLKVGITLTAVSLFYYLKPLYDGVGRNAMWAIKTATEESNKNIMGYKCVLNSKATEESLANLARWEPAHGRFNFCHPWKQYLKIGATMRRCASCVDALIGCIHSENKSSNDIRKIMSKTSMQVGDNSANVLRELALTIRNMTNSNKLDILVMEMNSAAQELQNLLKSYPNTQNNDDAKMEIPIMDIIQVVTMVSLLTEIVARVEDIVNYVEELSSLGKYKPAVSMCDKSKQHSTDNKISPEQQNEDEAIVKTLQMV